MLILEALRLSCEPALIAALSCTLRSNEVPTSILPVFEVLISRSSHSSRIFFSALISTSPSLASITNFFCFTSKVMVRFPLLSAMTIFSDPLLSSRTTWWPDLVWITTVMIQTKSGHQVVLDDKSGSEKIVIADKSGNRTITFDVKQKKFVIEAKEGDVEIKAEKKIRLECEDLEIKTSKTGKIDVGTSFDLNVQDKAAIKAGSQLSLKASRININ